MYLAQSVQPPESIGWRPAGSQGRVLTPVGATWARHNTLRGDGLQHPYFGFQDVAQEAVGTALGCPEAIDCIWHNQCSRLNASGGDQLAAKVRRLPQLVRLGGQLNGTKAPCIGRPRGSQSLQGIKQALPALPSLGSYKHDFKFAHKCM